MWFLPLGITLSVRKTRTGWSIASGSNSTHKQTVGGAVTPLTTPETYPQMPRFSSIAATSGNRNNAVTRRRQLGTKAERITAACS